MSNADDPVTCVACNETFRRRDLLATITVKRKVWEHCPKCKQLFNYNETTDQAESPAWLEDVPAIDDWLDSVAKDCGLSVQKVDDPESMGKFLWSIRGLPFSWECEAVYEQATPNVVTIRMRTNIFGAAVLADREALLSAWASQGVQPYFHKHTKSDSVVASWGAEQYLSTRWLMASLFRPVVDRLDEVLREVAMRFPTA